MKTKPRGDTPIDLICLHDPEGANTARELFRYLQGIDAGYHSLDDDHEEIICAGDDVVVQGAGGVNSRALHICFVPGRAAWSREQWLFHTAAIKRGAERAAAWGKLYGIPMQHLTHGQVATPGVKGICTHGDVTAAGYTASEGHTDPGPNFPMDVFLTFAKGQVVLPKTKEEPMWVAGPHKPVAGLPPGPAAGWFPETPNRVRLVSGQSIRGDAPAPNNERVWFPPFPEGAKGIGIYPYGVTTLRPLGRGLIARHDKGGAAIGLWS